MSTQISPPKPVLRYVVSQINQEARVSPFILFYFIFKKKFALVFRAYGVYSASVVSDSSESLDTSILPRYVSTRDHLVQACLLIFLLVQL